MTAPTPSGEAAEPLTADWFQRCVVFNAERKEITLSFGALVDEVERLHIALAAARRERDAVIMEAIELTVKSIEQQERDGIPREAQCIDYAGILRAALAATPEEK